MEKNVLTALWNKINDTFPTKGDLSASLIPKLDVETYNQSEIPREQAEQERQEAESARTTTFNALSAIMETSIISANSAADIAISAANRIDSAITQAETVDAELSGSVVTITNKEGVSKSIDLAAATDESVWITVTSSVDGVSVSGLTINVYYNGSSSPTTSVTTDNNGMAVLRVPNTYTYKLVFPSIQGCADIAPISHVATLSQRSVEVEYKEYIPGVDGEQVTVNVVQIVNGATTKLSGLTVNVTISGRTTQYITDSNGNAKFVVDYGVVYTVSVDDREGYYISPGNTQTQTFTSEKVARAILIVYRSATSGLFIVHEDGNEYNLLEWQNGVSVGAFTNAQAKLIHIKTSTLLGYNGTFGLLIDDLSTRNYSNRQWCDQNVEFYSIPLNGNSASANYYYDGLTASQLIQDEGDARGLSTPAVDLCLSSTTTVGSDDTLKTFQGFLGSTGQWSVLWANRVEIDDILQSVRPDGTNLFSTFTTNKWTCTQFNANYAYNWTTSANFSVGKNRSYAVVPFFAF